MEKEELSNISCDDDWLDLRDGDQGKVTGKLFSALRPGADSMLVSFPDWSTMHITIPAGYTGSRVEGNTPVDIIVTRNEDGVETDTASIHAR